MIEPVVGYPTRWAVSPIRAVGVVVPGSGDRHWEGLEAGERGGEGVPPGPVRVDAQEGAPLPAGEAGGDV